MQIDGSVVVVTGASTGIGRAVAQRLATRGCRLVLASRRTDRLEATASALKAAGAELAVLPTDIGIREDVERLAEFAWDAFGRVDVALFNAGIAGGDNLLDPDLEAWQAAIDTNVLGLLHCLKAFVPKMLRQEGESAVYATSSGAGCHGTTYNTAPYATTKRAQLSIMEALYGQARDAKLPLHVGVILPPLTRTNLAGDDMSIWESVEKSLSQGKEPGGLIEPEEFAHVIVDGIEQDRFWIESTEADDERYYGGRYRYSLRRSRKMIQARAQAMTEHTPPDPYLW